MKTERILVATDVAADADVVLKLLRVEFADVTLSSNAERAIADFEAHRPAVLVVAFNGLEKAERYSLGLYRLSSFAHTVAHRTIVLCSKDDLRGAYDLCRKSYFDDYVLFWPANHDAPRLTMAVHHALRELSRSETPTAGEFAAQARSIAGLAPLIEQHAAQAAESAQRADQSLQHAHRGIGAALDGLSRIVAEHPELSGAADLGALRKAIERVKGEDVERHLRAVADAVAPVRQLGDTFSSDLAPALQAARTLTSLADRVRPLVMIVDDDDFQRRLLERMLAEANVDTTVAASGTQALALLRVRRPDLVLMDVNLPDITGVETTRRLKAIDRFATIPVIMITGQSERAIVLDSIGAGAADFVVKPVEKVALMAKVRQRLGG